MPRFIAVNGFSLNVEAVKRIEYRSAHDRDMEFDEPFPGNSDSKYEKGAVVIMHDGGPGIWIPVDDEEWGTKLIELITREIVNGIEKLIDPFKMEENM